jgi:DNA-binding IclR family transcriptional regulator
MYRLGSIAAPILDAQGFARASISITCSVDEVVERADRQVRLVVAAAQRLSTMLLRKAPAPI